MHIQHLYWEGQKQNHLIQRVLLTKLLLQSQKNYHKLLLHSQKNYHNQVYILYTDNFYVSPELSRDLLDLGTYSSGTVRINRKYFPAALLNACALLKRGDHVFYFCEDITAVRWHDRKDVYALSTFTGYELTTVKR